MICTTCGATLDSTATTCPVCATPVAADAAGSSDATSGTEAAGEPGPDVEASTTRPTREPSDPPSSAAGADRDDATVGAGSSAYRGADAHGGADARGGTDAHGGADAYESAEAYRGADAHGGADAYRGAEPYGGQPALGPGPAAPGGAAWQPPSPHPSGLTSEVRGWGIAAHLIGLGGALLTVVTLGFAGPLVVWLLKRDDHPFIDHHAKESLNFQLTTLVALVVGALAAIPIFLLGFLTLGVLWLVALLVLLAATVVWFVFPIVGAIKAANGEGYRYPINIRFVR